MHNITDIIKLLLEPLSFLVLMLWIGLLLAYFTKQKGFGLLTYGIIILYMLSISPISRFLLYPLESKYTLPTKEDLKEWKPLSIVVILNRYNLSRSQKFLKVIDKINIRRLLASVYYAKRLKDVPIILCTIETENSKKKKDIEILRKSISQLGIIPKQIEKIYNANNIEKLAIELKNYLDKRPFLLITSAYQMSSTMMVFTRYGLSPHPAPCDYKVDNKKRLYLSSFFPNAKAIGLSTDALYEYSKLVYYYLKGKRGIHILKE